MSESIENSPGGEVHASLQELRRKAGAADRHLIETLAADIKALEARARSAEEECDRLRADRSRAGERSVLPEHL